MVVKKDLKKQAIAESIAAYLVANGFADSGIRTLAKAAGTSDRMLMYYFATKDEVIQAALMLITQSLTAHLDSLITAQTISGDQLLEVLTQAGRSEEFRPVIQLWFEIVGRAVRAEQPYRDCAQLIAANWQQWMTSKLPEAQHHQVEELFAQLEGRLMLHLIRF